jgi:hypothetical protein
MIVWETINTLSDISSLESRDLCSNQQWDAINFYGKPVDLFSIEEPSNPTAIDGIGYDDLDEDTFFVTIYE